jgi:hypothetical protein|tara:strand:- start:193 stop:510 length:318 start_codon:yes stop_codon:yes gene_type:complete
MKVYTFVIGTKDDFETIDDLMDYVEAKPTEDSSAANYSIFEFDAPDACDEETVTMIGRGLAFSNDWSMDHTFSFMIHGALDGPAENAAFDAGVQARLDLAQCSDV